MGPSGLLYGPTGSKIGGSSAAAGEPTGGDYKAWCDWHAADKLFGSGFYSSQVSDAMSFGADHVDGSLNTTTPTYVDGTELADGTPHMLFKLPAGQGQGRRFSTSRLGSAPVRWGFWPNSFLMLGFCARWVFDAAAIAANPGGGYGPYDQIKNTRHGFQAYYTENFFVGMHGGIIKGYAFDGASNPFVLTCGTGYVAHNPGWRGTFITSTVPLVSNKWYRILVARDGINTYFKVNAEPWQSSPTVYETFPITEQYRMPIFNGAHVDSGPNQVATEMHLQSIYTARGVQRINA